ncbi:MAG: 5,6-dimethylbenzimidazole synthase [Pseudomonadota bacterium]
MVQFSQSFQEELDLLMRWRRDVRRFRTDDVDEALLSTCLQSFTHSPSVGLSEPWRLVQLKSKTSRDAALQNFTSSNAQALAGYEGEQAKLYSTLKLSGMQEAPVQLAIFCDEQTDKGAGLGAGTMPEMRRYSVVAGIVQFWLTARAHGLGVGWVSILDPEQLKKDLGVSNDWVLVGYLCVGWPEANQDMPELERAGWETRSADIALEVC